MITATLRTEQRQSKTGLTQKTPRTEGLRGDRVSSTGKGINSSNLRDNRSSGNGFGSSNLREDVSSNRNRGRFETSKASVNNAPKNSIQRFRRPSNGSVSSVSSNSVSSSVSSSSGTTGVSGNSTTSRGLGSAAKGAIGKAGLGMNAAGEITGGIYGGGVGVGISTSGKLDLGVGVASVSWNFQNPNESALGFGFNTMTITGKQEGCTVILSYKILGQIVNQETRQADECGGNDDTDDENITKDPSVIDRNTIQKNSPNFSVPSDYEGQVCPMYEVITETYQIPDVYPHLYTQVSYTSLILRGELPQYEAYKLDGGSRLGDENYFYSKEQGQDCDLGSGWVVDEKTTYLGNLKWRKEFKSISGYLSLVEPYKRTTGGLFWTGTTLFRMYGEPIRSSISYCYVGKKPEKYKQGKTSKSRGLQMEENQNQQILMNRIYIMLGGDTFWEKGLMVHNSMFIPDGKGYFRMKSYNEIMNIIFRTFSHRTVGEIEFTIQDSNKGKKGNQSIEYKTVNAQGYFTNLMKTLVESKSENTDQLNVLVRLGLITSQLMKVLVITSENIKSIIGYLGVPQKDALEQVDIPFDLSLNNQLNKGFQSREDLQKELLKIVDADTEKAIESILDRFLDEWQMPVKVRKLRSSKEGGDFWFWLRQNIKR